MWGSRCVLLLECSRDCAQPPWIFCFWESWTAFLLNVVFSPFASAVRSIRASIQMAHHLALHRSRFSGTSVCTKLVISVAHSASATPKRQFGTELSACAVALRRPPLGCATKGELLKERPPSYPAWLPSAILPVSNPAWLRSPLAQDS